MTPYIAHIREKDGKIQPLPVHLSESKEIAENIGRKIGIPHVTGLAAWLHDMGKYNDDFQVYIQEAFNNPSQPPKRGSVNHSTAGARFLMQHYHTTANMMIECVANAIYSHHGQLVDMLDSEGESPFDKRKTPKKPIDFDVIEERFFSEVCTREELDAYVALAKKEFIQFLQPYKEKTKQATVQAIQPVVALVTKYIFSALLDADRTNSRLFDENVDAEKTESPFPLFLQRLEEQLIELQKKALPNEITKLRQQMSDTCFEKAKLPTGIYRLSIPTGGGKTLASLRFALQHALEHNKDRIIYIVPYTTIIEQNAKTVREVLQTTDDVLEHHSNVIDEAPFDEDKPLSYDELEARRKLANAKDNWDIPIVFTTMVQYLDTFYSGKSRNERRLHNLSNAIVIFDEVQSVPVSCISLFNTTLKFLSKSCRTTVLLCTATQPALDAVKRGIEVDGELIENLPTVIKAFKRTEIVPLIKPKGWYTEDVAEFVREKLEFVQNILIILNNRRVVKALYEELKHDDAHVYHLSTGMCVAHRKAILEEIREKLKDGERVICISTQLIEAGVDVSFQCVVRSLAGLDSIAQAAGRCNRNGEVAIREVYVINHAEESLKKLMTIEKGRACTDLMLRDMEKDSALYDGYLLSTKALTYYFEAFYHQLAPFLDYPMKKLSLSMYDILFTSNRVFKQEFKGTYPFWSSASFRTAAQHFEVIEANTRAIVVPYKEGEMYINQLISGERIADLSQFFKNLQQYSVNVFPYEFDWLCANSLAEAVDFGVTKVYVAKQTAYDLSYGLSVEGEAALANLDF
ncbi:CRISPR-associated helicase/endonuclease Cas3 [Metasolibacillus meyeri]|uniref:CRISPR-associated helicase/endonuclease Cas3 n=1 Tax=Metasolibacillus meyeri TaxID=1071052 RepID=UPI000D2F58D8|nr:CRISPR-associated helicase/endonuclease Cas3 [Metasolibacillus meyeri]